jgi:hypothetical protein
MSDFNENFNFLDRFLQNTQLHSFMKIHPMGAELFHADGRTDRRDETSRSFSQFCERAYIRVKV